jgi:hypothetical protein
MGHLSESSKEPKDGFSLVTYKDKEGNTKQKYVKKYSSVTGKIIGFDYRTTEWNNTKINSWNIGLEDEEGTMTVQLGAETRAAQSFLKMLPNINLELPLKIATFPDKESGATVVLCWQGDKKIDWAYTKDKPNGMPEAKRLANMKWDFSAVEEFLYLKGIEFSEKVNGQTITNTKEEDPLDFDALVETKNIPF